MVNAGFKHGWNRPEMLWSSSRAQATMSRMFFFTINSSFLLKVNEAHANTQISIRVLSFNEAENRAPPRATQTNKQTEAILG